ncbi:MAG: hypothetical protein ACLQPH_06310 [Acidimicrobiales bacterium]
MLASIWLPLLTAASVFLAFVVGGAALGTFLAWRYGRRKWRAFHSHGAVVGARTLWEATWSGRLRQRPAASSADMREWTSRRVRKELWRSVDQADAAVRTADDLGGPTASLPSLCGRLREAAIALDRVLRVEPAGPAPEEMAAQAADVMQAAEDVRRAAVASASDATGQRVRDLARDADQELQCLDAGLASTRAALPHTPR